jgi:hypothetical protein
VVEEAVPPLKRSSPKRTLLVIVSVFFGGVFGVLAVFLKTFFSESEEEEKIKKIKDTLALDAIWSVLVPRFASSNGKNKEGTGQTS